VRSARATHHASSSRPPLRARAGEPGIFARGATACGVAAALAVGALCGAARAQDAEPTAQQRAAAAEAYDRGTAAYLARDYESAARWFETAQRMAPAAPALMQAARAHDRAGNALRAATLALRLQQQYPNDRQAARVATELVTAGQRQYVRVDVRCEGCTVDLDGTLQEWPSFFVEPGREHVVIAHFETGDVQETVSGAAGERRELRFEAPPRVEAPDDGGSVGPNGWPAQAFRRRGAAGAGPAGDGDAGAARGRGDGEGAGEGRRDGGGGGLPPAVFLVSAGATVVAGGLLLWSGLDTLAGVADYEAMPTQEALDAGQAKELRTNILIGVTGAFGAATVAFLLLTNWGGDEAPPARAAVVPVEGGAVGVVGGRF
jgi:hypothetical protein